MASGRAIGEERKESKNKEHDDGFPLEVDDNSKWVCAARSA
jgi:hypothetical protein